MDRRGSSLLRKKRVGRYLPNIAQIINLFYSKESLPCSLFRYGVGPAPVSVQGKAKGVVALWDKKRNLTLGKNIIDFK